MESTETTKRAKSPKPMAFKAEPTAVITKMVPRDTPAMVKARERKLGGEYRLIHGRMAIPRPFEDTLYPNGTINPHEPTIVYAIPGDLIKLGDIEAARMLDADLIEELDAKPSRLNKVWAPPKAKPLASWSAPDPE